jgi:hypothetical protein
MKYWEPYENIRKKKKEGGGLGGRGGGWWGCLIWSKLTLIYKQWQKVTCIPL